jgi:diguanylate cyclase (GGDEF)-like protein
VRLHPGISKNIRKIFLDLGLYKGILFLTIGSILLSVLITFLISVIFGNEVGVYGFGIAIVVPAIVGTLASYVTLSLYFELEQSRREIHELAITDDLTQIFNRRHFFELADRELERTRRNGCSLAIVLFDIDDFKEVNDSLGHLAGDRVLQEMCRVCQVIVRPYDVFARFGGEEFIFLLPETDMSRARAFASRLRQLISSHIVAVNGTNIQMTISIGTAVYSSREDTLDDLISRADSALYKAKEMGKDRLELA